MPGAEAPNLVADQRIYACGVDGGWCGLSSVHAPVRPRPTRHLWPSCPRVSLRWRDRFEATLRHGGERFSNGGPPVMRSVLVPQSCCRTSVSAGGHDLSQRDSGHSHHRQPAMPDVMKAKVRSRRWLPWLALAPTVGRVFVE